MSTLISVRDHNGQTHIWMHRDGQTLAADSMPTSEAWQWAEGSMQEWQWFQTSKLLEAADALCLAVFDRKMKLDWLGKGWRVTY